MTFNDTCLLNYTSTKRTIAATHELEHVLGLDDLYSNHREFSIMRRSMDSITAEGITSSTSYDISELNII